MSMDDTEEFMTCQSAVSWYILSQTVAEVES